MSAKLSDASQCVWELCEAERPETPWRKDPGQIVVAFLHAARGVVPVLQTCAAGPQRAQDFDEWRANWEVQLSHAERALWLQMLDERGAQEHGEGAGLKQISIPLAEGMSLGTYRNYAALGITTPTGPTSFKGGVEFKVYPGRPASDVCGEYLALCRRFVDAFEQRYAYLLS